jgi:hypothetical protein
MIAEFISLLNTVTDIYSYFYSVVEKAIVAAINSGKPDTWVFLIRNSLPWIVKEPVAFTHSFCPTKHSFYKTGLVVDAANRLDDLVIAEVVDDAGILILDISETLHSISWSSAPSLYEMVIISFLSKGILLNEEILKTYSLSITTLDYPNLIIPLTHARMKNDFTGWEAYLSTPRA